MITDTLRTAARESGLTQTQLASAAGTSQRAMSEFLAGKSTLRLSSAELLAESLGCKFTVPKNFRQNIRKRIEQG